MTKLPGAIESVSSTIEGTRVDTVLKRLLESDEGNCAITGIAMTTQSSQHINRVRNPGVFLRMPESTLYCVKEEKEEKLIQTYYMSRLE
jgi:hypothetical protein